MIRLLSTAATRSPWVGSAPIRRGLVAAGLGAASLFAAACGDDDNNEPNVTAYTVTANQDDAEPQQDGGVQYTFTVTVTDSTGAIVPNAALKYDVSVGEITASNSLSDASGTGKVRWEVTAGERANRSNGTLSACADSQQQASCTPEEVATVDF